MSGKAYEIRRKRAIGRGARVSCAHQEKEQHQKNNVQGTSRISRVKEEHLFLAAALFFGLLWLFLIPPFQSPDENVHFFRSWSLSQGKIVPEQAKDEDGHQITGAYLPRSVAELPERLGFGVGGDRFGKVDFRLFWNSILKEDFNAGRDYWVFKDIGSGAYSPMCYLPQIAGIAVGRIFRLSPLGCFYLARVFVLFRTPSWFSWRLRCCRSGNT